MNNTANNHFLPAKAPIGGLGVQYLKHAWQLLKDNKLYSAIYIFGTALAITMVMIIAVFLYLKRGNIYPEENRNRILYVKSVESRPKDTTQHSMQCSGLSLQTVKQVFYPLKSAEAASAELGTYNEDNYVSVPANNLKIPVMAKYVDTNYWKVFQFRFNEGKPFTEADFNSGIHAAVISQTTARQLFGNVSAVGKYFKFNDNEYKVTGVAKDVSCILSSTYANIWIPFSAVKNYENPWGDEGLLGTYKVYMLARSSKDFEKIRKEIIENKAKYEANLTWSMNFLGQPDDTFTQSFRLGNRPLSMNKIRGTFALMLVIFLLVPVLNLSGLNSSRMEGRLSELGIRKSFGASRSVLINQVLTENLLLTALGGLVGLIFSYILIILSSKYLVSNELMYNSTNLSEQINNSVGITAGMLFNAEMFLWAFVAVLITNALSAFIPAYRFSRKNIVDSLFDNYKK